jgi:hypothetical protein
MPKNTLFLCFLFLLRVFIAASQQSLRFSSLPDKNAKKGYPSAFFDSTIRVCEKGKPSALVRIKRLPSFLKRQAVSIY